MIHLALALVICLELDGVAVEPIELTGPMVVERNGYGQKVTRLNGWDARRVEHQLRGRGFTREQAAAALRTFLLVEPTTEALRCGECITGGLRKAMDGSLTCVPGLRRSPCTSCTICGEPSPEPIACMAPPAG